jgi:hypothetical protein
MAKQFLELSAAHAAFIQKQAVYFVGTATEQSRINISPKGLDTLRILSPTRIVWLNLTGSGNESAAHVALSPRMTLMFCSFEQAPLILRTYGQARVIHPRDAAWAELHALFPNHPGARQLFNVTIDLVQTSCGFGVPECTQTSAGLNDRPTLNHWAEKKGSAGIAAYWQEKNQISIDGLPSHILDADGTG